VNKAGSKSEKLRAHHQLADESTGVRLRARAASDMSEFTVATSVPRSARAMEGLGTIGVSASGDTADSVGQRPTEPADRGSAFDRPAVNAEVEGAPHAAAEESAVSWMWRWGTLPVKKKTSNNKSQSSDAQLQSTHPQHSVELQYPTQEAGTDHDLTGAQAAQGKKGRAGVDVRGRAVSLPLLHRDDGAGSVTTESAARRVPHRGSALRRSHLTDHVRRGDSLRQQVTAVEADIPLASGNTTNAAATPQPATPAEPSLRDALLTGASAEEIADMFAAASVESATYKCLSLCGHILAGAGKGEASSVETASDVCSALQGHRVSPKDITADPSILQSAHLVVIVGDVMLPLTAAEKVLAARSRAAGEEPGVLKGAFGMGDVNEEEVSSALNAVVAEGTAGGDAAQLPYWAGRRISQWGVQASGSPHSYAATWQEALSDLMQAYRVQHITTTHQQSMRGYASSEDLDAFRISPLLQQLIVPGGAHLVSYHELWQRQALGRGPSFTALLTLDAGSSTSLYEKGQWARCTRSRSLSADGDGEYGVGYALHAEHHSETSGSHHSLPMLLSLDSSHDLRDSHNYTATAVPVATVTAAAASHPHATGYMRDAPLRSLGNPGIKADPSSVHPDGGDSSQPSVFEEGDTDNDNISLQDIDFDDISPEPAGGDFYDSDTDSYLSLSLEDGETGRTSSGKAGFHAVGAAFAGSKTGGAAGGPHSEGAALPRRRFRRYRYRKVLVPSQEQLELLNLQDGANDIVFELEGCAPLKCSLFVWPSDAKVVVTDLEGVFCRSQQSSRHSGVWISFLGGGSYYSSAASKTEFDSCIRLFAGLSRQGYRVIYLAQGAQSSVPTASSLLSSQDYLASIKASTGESLPAGPVFKSPDSLVRAFGPSRTEVFKASALRGVKSLFPASHNPYHACFCTREGDAVPFARFGFPEGRIFIVSEKRDIRTANRTCLLSFPRLNELLHQIFPYVGGRYCNSVS
jgi:hypothetical protein